MRKLKEISAVAVVFIIFWGGWALTGYFSVMSLVSLFSFELGAMAMYFAAAIVAPVVTTLFIELLKRVGFQRNWVGSPAVDAVDIVNDAPKEISVPRKENCRKIVEEAA